MTAFSAISQGGSARRRRKGGNQKDGGSQRQPQSHQTGFWGVEGFMPTAPGEWYYTWPNVSNCPVFNVVEKEFGIVATWRDMTRVYLGMRHIQIKDCLDAEILVIVRHDARHDVDILAATPTGEWIPF